MLFLVYFIIWEYLLVKFLITAYDNSQYQDILSHFLTNLIFDWSNQFYQTNLTDQTNLIDQTNFDQINLLYIING